MKTSDSFWLRFLANEDEAQHTGVLFTPVDKDFVAVELTFHHPEYETPPIVMAVGEARKRWKVLVGSGEYEFSG